jgi:nucleoside-diphosphate-sugar epimerase
MKILLIGGTGNISRSLVRLAQEAGHAVTLLNRGKRAESVDGAHTIVADIADRRGLAHALAGESYDSIVDFIAFTEGQIEATIAALRGRTAQYVFISSASAYQKPPSTPFIVESTPLRNPFWQYSQDKARAEARLSQAYREEGFPVVIVRPSLTYDTVWPVALGGWDDFTIVDRMRRGQKIVVHGDGTSLWTITHAEDFNRALLGLLGNPHALGEAFHITSDEVLTWNQIYETLASVSGCSANIVHIPSDFIAAVEPSLRGTLLGDKAHSMIFDNSKIKRFVPGWSARIALREGFARTLAWFEAEPSRQRVLKDKNELLDGLIAAYAEAARLPSRNPL